MINDNIQRWLKEQMTSQLMESFCLGSVAALKSFRASIVMMPMESFKKDEILDLLNSLINNHEEDVSAKQKQRDESKIVPFDFQRE